METISDRSLSQKSSQRSYKLRYTKYAKETFLSLLENAKNLEMEDRKVMQTKWKEREVKSVRYMNLTKIVAIIRLALILAKEDIHLADIFRWNEEGYMSIGQAEKLLPADVTVEKDVKAIFYNFPNSRYCLELNVGRLYNFLELEDCKMNLRPTIQRYCQELSLPVQIMEIIDKLLYIRSAECKISTTANYEGRAMAMIVFVLKLLFGLDGITERKLSELAAKVNNSKKIGQVQFSWVHWMKFINARGAVCSYYHASTREKLYPNSRFGGPDPFLSQWDNTPVRQIIKREHGKYLRKVSVTPGRVKIRRGMINHSLKDTLRRSLRYLMSDTVDPIVPSKTPMTSILNLVLTKHNHHISPKMMEILKTDFHQQKLDYLLSPDELQNCWGETEPDITIKSKLASEFILERAQTFPRQVRKIKPSNCKRKKVKLHFYNEYEKSFSSKKGTSPELECTSFSQDEDSVVKNSISGNVYNIPRECWIYKGKYSRLGTSAVQFDNFAME
uniref:Rrn7/TAF1B C-terminal cyclin domain-containing protein n=1 Tax=Rhodnius prolixus TaxID=13249 RepID=T1HIT9_RHOPR